MTLLHQAAQKAVEALKDLLDAHARNTLYSGAGHWEQGRDAIFALEDALQQQPEPVADKRRVAMETVYFRRSPSDQRQDSLTVLAGTATQHVREELIERIASAAGGIAASPSTTQQEAGDGPDWKAYALHYEKALRHIAETAFASKDWKYAREVLAAAPSTPAREEAGLQKAQDPYGY